MAERKDWVILDKSLCRDRLDAERIKGAMVTTFYKTAGAKVGIAKRMVRAFSAGCEVWMVVARRPK